MSLTSGSGRAKKMTKNECAAEIEITKYYAFNFTSGPHSAGEQPRAGEPSLARFSKINISLNIPKHGDDAEELISFPVIRASPAMISFMAETILFCCLVAA